MKGHVASLVGVCVLTLGILVSADVTLVHGRGAGAGSGAGPGGGGSGGTGGTGGGTGGTGGGGAGTAGTGAGAAAASPGDAAGVGDGPGAGDAGGTAANTNPIGNWMRTFAEVEPVSPTATAAPTTTVVVTPEGRQIVIEGVDRGFPAAFPATGTTRPFYSGIGTCPDLDHRTDTRCFETP